MPMTNKPHTNMPQKKKPNQRPGFTGLAGLHLRDVIAFEKQFHTGAPWFMGIALHHANVLKFGLLSNNWQ